MRKLGLGGNWNAQTKNTYPALSQQPGSETLPLLWVSIKAVASSKTHKQECLCHVGGFPAEGRARPPGGPQRWLRNRPHLDLRRSSSQTRPCLRLPPFLSLCIFPSTFCLSWTRPCLRPQPLFHLSSNMLEHSRARIC